MDKNNVLLINLPTTGWYKNDFSQSNSMPPLGILYIATILEKNGYMVKIIDFAVEKMGLNEFQSVLEEYKPFIVGMSTYNESWDAEVILSRLVKKINHQISVFAGGAFATFCYESILNEGHTDFVVTGEGEYAVLDLCNVISGRDSRSLCEIDGLIYFDKASIHCNPKRERIMDLDQLPYPNRDLVRLDRYAIAFTISTARGCPGKCIFCSSKAFWGKRVIMRSVQNIFDEVMMLHNKYHTNVFYITDDTFTASTIRVKEFCEMIKATGVKFVWGCESRADVVNDELLKCLKEAGCTKIQFGLESANNEILKKLKKHVTIEQIENAVALAYKHKMHITTSYIIGHYCDTIETIEETLSFVKRIQSDYGAFVVGSVNTPFPGTEQYEKSEELGIKIHTSDWNNYRLDNPIIDTANLSLSELREYYERVKEITANNHMKA